MTNKTVKFTLGQRGYIKSLKIELADIAMKISTYRINDHLTTEYRELWTKQASTAMELKEEIGNDKIKYFMEQTIPRYNQRRFFRR